MYFGILNVCIHVCILEQLCTISIVQYYARIKVYVCAAVCLDVYLFFCIYATDDSKEPSNGTLNEAEQAPPKIKPKSADSVPSDGKPKAAESVPNSGKPRAQGIVPSDKKPEA